MVFVYYTYSTSNWGDLLTNYDGTAITYDSIGNPTKWRNSTSLTWDGRTLTSQTLTNGNSITYKYNSDGIRTQKRVFDDVASAYITHDYVLDGCKILSETVTDNAYYNSYTLYYIYDASGSITGLHYNNQPYYFQKNIQGDILCILDRTGTAVVEYTYDAWGNILSVTGSMANTLGKYNPFRYRGYYYDSETGLYYLQTRYYDAAVGRFISADSYVSTGQGTLGNNMFAYCGNNPVSRIDLRGKFWEEVCEAFGTAFDFLFGAEYTETVTLSETETVYIPSYMPITCQSGVVVTQTVNSVGDPTGLISFYANHDLSDPIVSSNAGVNINLWAFSLEVSLGFDDISLSGAVDIDDTTHSLGAKLNITEFKIGAECASSTQDGDITTTLYTNTSFNGWWLAVLYGMYGSYSPSPTPSPTPGPLPTPIPNPTLARVYLCH